jgi:hypothetical protein
MASLIPTTTDNSAEEAGSVARDASCASWLVATCCVDHAFKEEMAARPDGTLPVPHHANIVSLHTTVVGAGAVFSDVEIH